MFKRVKVGRPSIPKLRVPKIVRNALVSAGVLLLIFVATGVGYTYVIGGNDSENVLAVATTETITEPIIKPSKPAANAKVGASVQTITSPVTPGSNTSVTIRTLPEAICTISVKYNDVPSTDSGLSEKTADEFGMVTWTWTVTDDVPEGTWPVEMLCARNENSGMVQAKLEVKNNLEQVL